MSNKQAFGISFIAMNPFQNASNNQNDLSLTHNLMLYERHRREILGNRNRRLLGKTKSSRILEEQNNALVTAKENET